MSYKHSFHLTVLKCSKHNKVLSLYNPYSCALLSNIVWIYFLQIHIFSGNCSLPCEFVQLTDCIWEQMIDNRGAPCRSNKLSSSSSIICVDVYASKSTAWDYKDMCINCPSPVGTAWMGDDWGKAALIHFLPPPSALIEKFGWPCLFALVECGGQCFLRLFLSVAAP